jgi:hypothetical protein
MSTSRLTESPGWSEPRVERRNRERDAVDGDRALLDAVAEDLRRRLDGQPFALEPAHPADAVHVALEVVPAQRVACHERRLEVDRVAEALRPRRGLSHHVEGKVAVLGLDDGQADPVDVDRVADLRHERRLDDQAAVGEREGPRPLPNDPREHGKRLLPEGDRFDRLADERLELRPRDVRPGELAAQLLDQLLRFRSHIAGLGERLPDLADIDVAREPARERLNQIRAR